MKADRPLQELGWHHPLQFRESAPGFASRLAALNGRSLGRFLREMAVHPRDLDKSKPDAIRAISLMGAADFEQLENYTPRPLNTDYWGIGTERLGRLSINRTYFRYCPRCISEDVWEFSGPVAARPWLRLEWTISFFRSCPRHQIYLETANPVRRPFEPFDFSETMAGKLAEMSREADTASASSTSPFQLWLQQRLDGTRDNVNWLDDLELYVAAGFCEALGLSALHPSKVRTSTLSMHEWAMCADVGFEIASVGEQAIRELLGKLNEGQSSTRGVWGPRDTYGHAYGLLQKTVGDPGYEKLRKVVREFALVNMPFEPGTNVLGQVVEDQAVHTIRTASKVSGAHARTIRKFFKRKGLGQSNLVDHRVTVDADEISSVVEALKDALTTPQVEKLTRIPRLHLNAMIAAGHLPTVTDTNTTANAKHRFARLEVDAMMERLFLGATDVQRPEPRQLPMMAVRQAACATTLQLLGFVFDQKVKWKGRQIGALGYEALLLDADEVTKLVRSGEEKSGLTKQEAREFIPGMGKNSVQLFIDSGHLILVDEFNPEARRITAVVSRESAEEFLGKYVSLGELSGKSGLHHKKVRLLLRGVGIEAVFDPEKFGSFFYERQRIEHLTRDSPHFWEYDKANAQARKVILLSSTKA